EQPRAIVLGLGIAAKWNFFFQAEDGIRDKLVTGVQTCALPISTSLGNVTTSEGYSSFGELATFSAAASSSALYAATYTRDPLGRVETVTEAIVGDTSTLGYGYDARGRLTSVTSNGSTVASYEYDQNGNRVRFTGPA